MLRKFVVIILVFLVLMGCANEEFNNNYRQYKNLYYETTEFVEDVNGNDDLKLIDLKPVEKNVEALTKYLKKIKENSKSEDEKRIYTYINERNNELVFLMDMAKKESWTTDEKRKLFVSLINIKSYRGGLKR